MRMTGTPADRYMPAAEPVPLYPSSHPALGQQWTVQSLRQP